MLYDDLELWDGGWEEGPRGRGYIHAVVQQKLTKHCKAIILQFKK